MGTKRENTMTNCIDITNLTSDQLDTLFNDLTTGKKTFKQAVAENPAHFSIIIEDEEKEQKDAAQMMTKEEADHAQKISKRWAVKFGPKFRKKRKNLRQKKDW